MQEKFSKLFKLQAYNQKRKEVSVNFKASENAKSYPSGMHSSMPFIFKASENVGESTLSTGQCFKGQNYGPNPCALREEFCIKQ